MSGAHLKNHELANLCAERFGQLTEFGLQPRAGMQLKRLLRARSGTERNYPVKTFSV
jgi:hypothetical protein